MPVPKSLKLGQFAANTQIDSLIEGAFTELSKVSLPYDNRVRVRQLKQKYASLRLALDSPVSATEEVWLELEEMLESLLPEYTTLDGNKVVPDWGRIAEAHSRAPGTDLQPWVGSVRTQLKTAPMFVLEQVLPGDDAVLYRKVRAGRGHLWRELWRVTADQVPQAEPGKTGGPHTPTD